MLEVIDSTTVHEFRLNGTTHLYGNFSNKFHFFRMSRLFGGICNAA